MSRKFEKASKAAHLCAARWEAKERHPLGGKGGATLFDEEGRPEGPTLWDPGAIPSPIHEQQTLFDGGRGIIPLPRSEGEKLLRARRALNSQGARISTQRQGAFVALLTAVVVILLTLIVLLAVLL